jgi:hypothetical protein
MSEGFFRVAFTGAAGSGFGMLVLRNGIAVGADVAGATFDGSYIEDQATQMIELDVIMTMPAGATPVQTGIPLPELIRVPIKTSISEAEIITEIPKLVRTTLGPVNVVFKKLRDFPQLV